MTCLRFLPLPALLGLLAWTGGAVRMRAAPAEAGAYAIDPAHSSVGFTARLLGRAVPGGFARFSGTVRFDPEHPDQTRVQGRIEIASLSTGNDRRDHHLASPDYFDAARFPAMTFTAEGARALAGGDLELAGRLTIKDITKTVTLAVHPTGAAAGARRWEARTQLNRKDFGVARDALPDRGIGDPIDILLEIQLRPAG